MLTVRISEEARRAIDSYCADQGITVTAWVEAVGQRIQHLQTSDDVDVTLRSVADDTVRIARLIDKERRARLPDQ
jgi:hypothetical protein